MRQRSHFYFLFVAAGFLPAGCHSTHAPTVDVFGSYFPAWIICVVIGLLLTMLTRLILMSLKIEEYLRPAPLVYLGITTGFTLVTWLIFFKN